VSVLAALRHRAEGAAGSRTVFVETGRRIDFRTLAGLAGGVAARAAHLPERVGLLAPNGIAWLAADLGLVAAGRTVVPLPGFFTDLQLRHIAADAGLSAVLTATETTARAIGLGLRVEPIEGASAPLRPEPCVRGGRVVYTSGSTAAPKGVRFGQAQIDAVCAGLLQALKLDGRDRTLSLLPFSLLLEAIAALYLPILAGGRSTIGDDLLGLPPATAAARLVAATEQARPTALVLVPELLRLWLGALAASGRSAPGSLRFVAVGGAMLPPALAGAAERLGIPVLEGYGLTECGSVVALNRPGRRRAGTVGRALPGCRIEIVDGEVTVRAPGAMLGYLGSPDRPPGTPVHTGDLGELDADGYLRVLGRRDSLLVLANGRNVSPEWLEGLIACDSRVARAVVIGQGLAGAVALLEAAHGELPSASELCRLCADAPAPVRPAAVLPLAAGELARLGLLTANGRPRRPAIHTRFRAAAEAALAPIPETEPNHVLP